MKFVIFGMLFVVVGLMGWVNNILKLLEYHGDVSHASVVHVLRVVGIFVPPLGTVMGFV